MTLEEFLAWLHKPKKTLDLLIERAAVPEEQFTRFDDELVKGYRKPTKRNKAKAWAAWRRERYLQTKLSTLD